MSPEHKQLVQALDGAAGAGTDARTRRYVYLYLLHHLAEAKEGARLDALLLDPGWLQAKLDATAESGSARFRLPAVCRGRSATPGRQDPAIDRRRLLRGYSVAASRSIGDAAGGLQIGRRIGLSGQGPSAHPASDDRPASADPDFAWR